MCPAIGAVKPLDLIPLPSFKVTRLKVTSPVNACPPSVFSALKITLGVSKA